MSKPVSQAIFDDLLAAAPPKRQQTLERLRLACDDLHRTGRMRFQDVERRIIERFGRESGPRAQTISNEKKLPLGMYHYVEARRREAESAARLQPTSKSKYQVNILHSIDAVTDFDLRNTMREVYDRMLVAEAYSARAKHVLRTTRPGADIDSLLSGAKPISRTIIDDVALSALRKMRAVLTNDEKLSSCGLERDNGQIRRKGRLGDELLPASVMRDFLEFCAVLDAI